MKKDALFQQPVLAAMNCYSTAHKTFETFKYYMLSGIDQFYYAIGLLLGQLDLALYNLPGLDHLSYSYTNNLSFS